MKTAVMAAGLVCTFGVSGCGTGVGFGASGTANFLNGPTVTASSLMDSLSDTAGPIHALSAPASGNWYLTPDQATLTVTSISFLSNGSAGNSSTVNCTVTYNKTAGTLSNLGSCPFSVSPGTYNGVQITTSTIIQMLVNDTADNIYTNPSAPYLISTTSPAGGAQTISFNQLSCTSCQTQGQTNVATFQSFFPSPITVTSGSNPQLYVVFDPVHWIEITIASGATTGLPSSAGTGIPIVPSITSISSAEYYSNVGTLATFNATAATNPTGLKVYYAGGVPARMDFRYGIPSSSDGIGADSGCNSNMGSSAWPGSSLTASPGGGNPQDAFFGIGGYLGLDSNSNLSWGLPVDFSYTTWAAVFSMARATAVGQSTTLKYLCTTSVPAPTTGNTYASGAPSFTAAATRSLTLMTR